MSYKKLLQQRADLRDRLAALHAKVASGKATKEDDAAANDIQGKIETCSAQIDREESNFNNGHPLPPARLPGGASGWGGGAGSDDDGGFANMGDMMASVFKVSRGEGVDDRLKKLAVKAASINEGVGSEGGFPIPTQFVDRALNEDLEDVVLLQFCDRQIMTSNAMNVPAFVDDSHAATAPFGINWQMVPEGGSFGTIQGTPFRAMNLVARKAGALFLASNEWMTDSSTGIRARLENIWRASLRWYVENLLWAGSGAGQPLGALASGGAVSIDKEVGQEPDSIQTENVVKMWSRLRPGSHGRSIWACNASCLPALATLVVGVGTAGNLVSPLLQVGTGIAGSPTMSIFGRPLHLSEHLPAVGDAGDICLLDPTLYLLGDRKQITLDASPHARFETDQTVFRATVRLDAQPIYNNPLTPKNGPTAGWLVKIGAR